MVEVLVMKNIFLFYCSQVITSCLAVILISGCRSSPSRNLSEINNIPAEEDLSEYDDLALFTEALLLINRYYVDESDFTDLVYSAIDGMIGVVVQYTRQFHLQPDTTAARPLALNNIISRR